MEKVIAPDNTYAKTLLRRTLKRSQVRRFFAQCPPCLIGIEACGSMHYWVRELTALGHEVRAMAPVFVKPYRKGNKTDSNDAEALCEAVQRPNMRFVSARTPEQQSVLHLHHSRQLLLKQRVALGNHLRGVLHEYGVVLPRGTAALSGLPDILEDGENGLPMAVRELLRHLKEMHDQVAGRIAEVERLLQVWHQGDEFSQRLTAIPGVGWLTATVLSAVVGDGSAFRNGRQLAAYLGLVPRQHSSGGKVQLLGISKRGDGRRTTSTGGRTSTSMRPARARCGTTTSRR